MAGVVDTHHHFFPPAFLKNWEEWEERNNLPHYPTQGGWSISRSLEEMDKGGVSTAILSIASTPGVWFDHGPEAATRTVRQCCEFAADMIRDHPGRYGLFAPLSMLDIDTTLREIEYVFDTLHADGVGLQTNYGDTWPGDPKYAPVFDELNRRKAVVYFHPLVAKCDANITVGAHQAVLEVPHDTTRAIVSLLLHGAFARYRNIRWLFSHGGGTLPYLIGRITGRYDSAAGRDKLAAKRAEFAPDGIEAELKKLYFDTANALHPAQLAALRAFMPPTQLTFGSDYPYFAPSELAEKLDRSGLAGSDLAGLRNANIARLIPRLAAAE
jgi:predicted TIM-barrel fold metal-dependent hydrolase